MTDTDLYDGLEFEPDSQVIGALTPDEAALLDAYRALGERGQQAAWTMLQLLFRARRQGVDDGP